MQVKTYVGRSATEIMARIKSELGPDAIILGTHTRTIDGTTQVEILAARETPLPSGETPLPTTNQPSASSPLDPLVGAPTSPSTDPTASLLREWELLRRHLMAALKPGLDTAGLSPQQRLLLDTLERENVEDTVRLALAERFRAEPSVAMLPLLEGLTPVRPWTPTTWPGRVHLFAGPSGGGASTVALRLALHVKRAQPKLRLILVHGAANQSRFMLRHYAELSGLTFRDAHLDGWPTPEEFDLCLVDAPVTALGSIPQPLRHETFVHAIMPALLSTAHTQRFLDRVQGPHLASIIWTKLDEACSFGQIVNQAVRTNLPVSLISMGGELKNTLASPSARDLWRLILRHQLPHPNLAFAT